MKNIGDFYELVVCDYLANFQSHTIVSKDYRFKFVEIDIISVKNKLLHIHEVKFRSSEVYGEPYEFVHPQKLIKLNKAGLVLMQKFPTCTDLIVNVFSLQMRGNICSIERFVLD